MKKNILILSILLAIIAISALVFSLKNIFLKPREEARPKVAIIIDDWGYNLRCLNLLKQIDAPITVSVLPNLNYSSEIAEAAKSYDKEIILHLPLEPEEAGRKIGLEEHTITSDMPDEEIIKNIELAFASVPYACGVSNHMGSCATGDVRLMSTTFAELKKRELFFLDNLVTNKSVCKELAAKMKIKFARRNIFLDNLDSYDYIKGQVEKLGDFARRKGQAVGIGHPKVTTLKVLKDMIPQMQAEGIEFVFVSELAE
ncbi:MAG: divergent polysaccharide deacetylase family protein [Candidatus Omnitrophota bacterium]|nr:MAG: divergent polysaccharide deacetylase family protein [Candidatus Omnitrophota bacterium]